MGSSLDPVVIPKFMWLTLRKVLVIWGHFSLSCGRFVFLELTDIYCGKSFYPVGDLSMSNSVVCAVG